MVKKNIFLNWNRDKTIKRILAFCFIIFCLNLSPEFQNLEQKAFNKYYPKASADPTEIMFYYYDDDYKSTIRFENERGSDIIKWTVYASLNNPSSVLTAGTYEAYVKSMLNMANSYECRNGNADSGFYFTSITTEAVPCTGAVNFIDFTFTGVNYNYFTPTHSNMRYQDSACTIYTWWGRYNAGAQITGVSWNYATLSYILKPLVIIDSTYYNYENIRIQTYDQYTNTWLEQNPLDITIQHPSYKTRIYDKDTGELLYEEGSYQLYIYKRTITLPSLKMVNNANIPVNISMMKNYNYQGAYSFDQDEYNIRPDYFDYSNENGVIKVEEELELHQKILNFDMADDNINDEYRDSYVGTESFNEYNLLEKPNKYAYSGNGYCYIEPNYLGFKNVIRCQAGDGTAGYGYLTRWLGNYGDYTPYFSGSIDFWHNPFNLTTGWNSQIRFYSSDNSEIGTIYYTTSGIYYYDSVGSPTIILGTFESTWTFFKIVWNLNNFRIYTGSLSTGSTLRLTDTWYDAWDTNITRLSFMQYDWNCRGHINSFSFSADNYRTYSNYYENNNIKIYDGNVIGSNDNYKTEESMQWGDNENYLQDSYNGNWINYDSDDTDILICDEWNGHSNLIQMFDKSTTNYCKIENIFENSISQGSIEFYYLFDEETPYLEGSGYNLYLYGKTWGDFTFQIAIKHNLFTIFDGDGGGGGTWYDYSYCSYVNVWEHLKIDFDKNEFDVYLNGYLIVQNMGNRYKGLTNSLSFESDVNNNEYNIFLDSLSYSWEGYEPFSNNPSIFDYNENANWDFWNDAIYGTKNIVSNATKQGHQNALKSTGTKTGTWHGVGYNVARGTNPSQVDFWVNIGSLRYFYMLFRETSIGNNLFTILFSSGNIYLNGAGGSLGYYNDNRWIHFHIEIVTSGAGVVYMNGKQIISTTCGAYSFNYMYFLFEADNYDTFYIDGLSASWKTNYSAYSNLPSSFIQNDTIEFWAWGEEWLWEFMIGDLHFRLTGDWYYYANNMNFWADPSNYIITITTIYDHVDENWHHYKIRIFGNQVQLYFDSTLVTTLQTLVVGNEIRFATQKRILPSLDQGHFYLDAIDFSWSEGYYEGRNLVINNSDSIFNWNVFPNYNQDEYYQNTQTGEVFRHYTDSKTYGMLDLTSWYGWNSQYYSSDDSRYAKFVQEGGGRNDVLELKASSTSNVYAFYDLETPITSNDTRYIVIEFWAKVTNHIDVNILLSDGHLYTDRFTTVQMSYGIGHEYTHYRLIADFNLQKYFVFRNGTRIGSDYNFISTTKTLTTIIVMQGTASADPTNRQWIDGLCLSTEEGYYEWMSLYKNTTREIFDFAYSKTKIVNPYSYLLTYKESVDYIYRVTDLYDNILEINSITSSQSLLTYTPEFSESCTIAFMDQNNQYLSFTDYYTYIDSILITDPNFYAIRYSSILITITDLFNNTIGIYSRDIGIGHNYITLTINSIYLTNNANEPINITISGIENEDYQHYKGEYSFDYDLVNNEPTSINDFGNSTIGSFGYVNILKNIDGHSKVLDLYDSANTGYTYANINYNSKSSGNISFWFRADKYSSTSRYFYLNKDDTQIFVVTFTSGGEIWIYKPDLTWNDTGLDLVINTWYHVLIEFDCNLDIAKLYLNGNYNNWYIFKENTDSINKIRFTTGTSQYNYHYYIDAIDTDFTDNNFYQFRNMELNYSVINNYQSNPNYENYYYYESSENGFDTWTTSSSTIENVSSYYNHNNVSLIYATGAWGGLTKDIPVGIRELYVEFWIYPSASDVYDLNVLTTIYKSGGGQFMALSFDESESKLDIITDTTYNDYTTYTKNQWIHLAYYINTETSIFRLCMNGIWIFSSALAFTYSDIDFLTIENQQMVGYYYVDAFEYSLSSSYYELRSFLEDPEFMIIENENIYSYQLNPYSTKTIDMIQGEYCYIITDLYENILEINYLNNTSINNDIIYIPPNTRECFVTLANQRNDYLNWENYMIKIDNQLIYSNIFYEELNEIVNISIYSRFNQYITSTIHQVNRDSNYIPIQITQFSLKIFNQQEKFIHSNLTFDPNYVTGMENVYWSEWLAPNEITEYLLSPNYYRINITEFETYTSQIYSYTLVTDDILLISSYNTIANAIYNIQNVNTTLGNQITNVEINITNQNSNINNSIINVEINLSNVNSTLGNFLVSQDLKITDIGNNITTLFIYQENQFSFLHNNITTSYTNLNNSIYLMNNTIYTGIQSLSASIENTNNTILGSLNILLEVNDELTEIFVRTMFSNLLNYSLDVDDVMNQTQLVNIINRYNDVSTEIEFKYLDQIEKLTIAGQETLERWLPSSGVEYRVKSLEDNQYIKQWTPITDNVVDFGYYKREGETILHEGLTSTDYITSLLIIFIAIALWYYVGKKQNTKRKTGISKKKINNYNNDPYLNILERKQNQRKR